MLSKLASASRILLGFIFTIFGLNGLMLFTLGHGFIPNPPPPESMQTIMAGFIATGYMLILVKLLEVVAGLFLLWGRFINAAIVLLGPIIVNIFCIHLFVERSGLPMAIFITACFLILIKSRWEFFKPMLIK